MGILQLLGLNAKKKEDGKKPEQQKTAPNAQHACCGSCGGQGHADKKGNQS